MAHSLGAVIPVYNVENYLRECLDSVMGQAVPFDEILVVNDGSEDESLSICREYCRKYPQIKLFSQENKGLSAARNLGMAYAKSEYLIFLDSDDYLDLRTAGILKQKLSGQDVLYYGAAIQEDMEGTKHRNIYQRKEKLCGRLMTGMEYFYEAFPGNYVVSACLGAYKNVFLKNHGIRFPEGLYYEDNFFQIQVVCEAEKVECISEGLYIRRYRPGSITTTPADRKKYRDRGRIQLKIWDYLQSGPQNKWKEEVKKKFILRDVLQMRGLEKQYSSPQEIKTEKIWYLKQFLEYWEAHFLEGELSFDVCCVFLYIYEELKELNEKINFRQYGKVKNRFKETVSEKLGNLCFDNPHAKVGIYGKGKHTEAMFALYERMIGKIRCQYIFIVSDPGREQEGFPAEDGGHPTVSFQNIPGDMDRIILSSSVYMAQMAENLARAGIDSKKGYKLYDEGDVCDLIMAYDVVCKEKDYFWMTAGEWDGKPEEK